MTQNKKPAAFLDRDGVLCDYVDHLHRIEDFRLRTGVGEAVLKLNEAGFWVFVITNQPMIGKGLLTLDGLEQIHGKMQRDIKSQGARLDAIQFCPHSPGGPIEAWNKECSCRKPKTGMIDELLRSFPVDLTQSFLAGDTWRDIECAKSAGLKSYGITGGAGFPYPDHHPHQSSQPDRLVGSLLEAVEFHLSNLQK